MAIVTLKKHLFATVAGIALAMGLASTAQAVPVFTVNPSALGAMGSAGMSFEATSLTGDSSELLHFTATGHRGLGFINYGYIATTNEDNPRYFLNGNFGIYVLFDLVDTSGSPENTLTKLDFTMVADINNNNKFIHAKSPNGSGSEARVNNAAGDQISVNSAGTIINGGGDQILARGSLISGAGSFNSQGGAALNTTTTFNLTEIGKSFFISPTPFFSMSFNGFNNQTGGAVSNSDNTVTINAAGVTSFAVPEPTSVALLGLGLLGLCATGRRRRKN